MREIKINGSWGILIVDVETGVVQSATGVAYGDIARIDIGEYLRTYGRNPTGGDILDFGYWTKEANLYIAPDEYHREMMGAGWMPIVSNEAAGRVLQ